MTDMYLISGFLGAGKTTLIQKLLTEAFKSKKVALIENDFGDFSVDAALLREGGYQVLALNAGCICCSLTGDFTAALASLLKTYRPDVVLIEPSGVGKLSDVERACRDRRFATSARITQKITVVDVKRCASYLENFGAFFEERWHHPAQPDRAVSRGCYEGCGVGGAVEPIRSGSGRAMEALDRCGNSEPPQRNGADGCAAP